MKKTFYFLVSLLVISALFNSCNKKDEFDEELLYGKWRTGNEYWVYERGHTGYFWVEGLYTEEQGKEQPFTWSLVKSELRFTHFDGRIPKPYTVTELTANTLKYKDDFDRSHSFTKVP